MTIEAVEFFTTVMKLPAIVALLGTTDGEPNIYWDLAEEETSYPFLTFKLADEGFVSKDAMMTYNATVRIFAKNLTEAVTIGSQVRTAVKENYKQIRDRGSVSGYADAEAKDAFMEITYNFKK